MAHSGLSIGTATGGGTILVDNIGGTLWPVSKLAWGSDGTATEIADTTGKRLPVTLPEPPGGVVTPGDSVSNPTGVGQMAALGMEWDSSDGSWFRVGTGRVLDATRMLAGVERTATTSSPVQRSYGCRGVAMQLLIISAPGSGGDLSLRVFGCFEGMVTYPVTPAFTIKQSLGNTAWYVVAGPGGPERVTDERFIDVPIAGLSPRWFAVVTHADAQPWTYTLRAVLLS